MGSLPLLLVSLVIFGFIGRAAWNAYNEKKHSEESALLAEIELTKLKEREEFVRGELQKFSTESGKESQLREKFGVARPGEQVAIIIEVEDEENILENDGFFSEIRAFFGSLFEK